MTDLVLASVLWSLSFGLIKTYLSSMNPVWVALIRLGLSFLLFVPFLRFPAGKICAGLMALGSLQFGLMYCLYIASYRYLAAHEVALLTISTPLMVVFFDALLERRWSKTYFGAACCAVLGTGVLVFHGQDWEMTLRGVLLLTGANACFAAGQLGYRKVKPKSSLSDCAAMAWMYLGAVLVPFVSLAFDGGASVTLPTAIGPWLALLYLGLIPSGLGFFLWNRGVGKVNSGCVAVMNNLKIPLATVAAWLIFSESVAWIRFLLCAILLFAAAWMTRKPK